MSPNFFVFKSLLTMPSNVLPLHLKETFPFKIWIFTEGEGDVIKSRLPFKIFSTLHDLEYFLTLAAFREFWFFLSFSWHAIKRAILKNSSHIFSISWNHNHYKIRLIVSKLFPIEYLKIGSLCIKNIYYNGANCNCIKEP